MELYDFICRPKMTWLNINRQCNFRCKWCYNEATGFKTEETMSYETAKSLIDISKEAGVEHLHFIGGSRLSGHFYLRQRIIANQSDYQLV